MKDWLKENWFKLGMLAALAFSSYVLYQSLIVLPEQQKLLLEQCVQKAKKKQDDLSKGVFDAWLSNKVDSAYKDQGMIDIQKLYEDQRSECYRIYD